MKSLGFVLLLGFISLGAIGGCSDNNGGDSDSIGSGPGFAQPRGIAVEADGSLVVTDFGLERRWYGWIRPRAIARSSPTPTRAVAREAARTCEEQQVRQGI